MIVRTDSASFTLWKSAPSSVSAVEESTLRVMEERTMMVPLMGVGVVFRDSRLSGVADAEERG